MKMYEELIKSLQEATEWKNASIHYSLMNEAAKAIEILSVECKDWKERGDALEKALNVAFSDFAKIMENRSWVSVMERLPKTPGRYLCNVKAVMGDNYYIDICQWDGFFFPYERTTNRITHWMPLPEPPKKET